jgi:hypothetical protein
MAYNSFYLGETVPFAIEIRNAQTSDLLDPDSITITVANNGVLVNNDAMIKDSVGVYHYNWMANAIGNYQVVYKAIDNGKTTIAKDTVNITN